ncbi:MAG: lipoyl(octanoyl) transferase LipB [Chitinophagaceae bacterium]
MDKRTVIFKDLGLIEYKDAWDYQESLLQENVRIKSLMRQSQQQAEQLPGGPSLMLDTVNHFLFCEHPPVYTLGKSGNKEHVLLSDEELKEHDIQFYNTNRGGDITFHGLQQIVGYPILDLEKFSTDIGKYLRNLEEIIILTIAEFGIKGERSAGETGVWIEPGIIGKERKICAIGVRCSRWITMHGFALNVNTNLDYFNHIIPCGIQNKQVTSIKKELGEAVDYDLVKKKIKKHFSSVFDVELL